MCVWCIGLFRDGSLFPLRMLGCYQRERERVECVPSVVRELCVRKWTRDGLEWRANMHARIYALVHILFGTPPIGGLGAGMVWFWWLGWLAGWMANGSSGGGGGGGGDWGVRVKVGKRAAWQRV